MNPVDMRVNLAGVELKNPVVVASGTFGFGREFDQFYDISALGGICCKGLTLHPREGNPPPRIAETPAGILNSVGLQNPGVEGFIEHELPWLHVYCPKQSTLLADYGITGFPTKIIIGPDGKIVKTVVGEDPAFYTLRDELFSK